MDNDTTQETPFSNSDISDLCDAIKNNHQILNAVGDFFEELGLNQSPGGNGFLVDFKKWGIRTVAGQILEKQFSLISRITELYQDEQTKLKSTHPR